MNKITLSIAAAVLATGLATGASAATAPAAPANTSAGITFQAPQVKVPTVQQASYFYRYRCYYFRYGYNVYRRCYIRYYYY